MAAAAYIPFWMAGAWVPNPAAGETLTDVNGVLITVGATVKLVGTVVAVSGVDPHFSGIQVVPNHPNGPNGSKYILNVTDSTNPQLGHQANPQLPINYYFDPKQLVVGS